MMGIDGVIENDDDDFFGAVERENREETARLTQPVQAFDFLRSIKELADDYLYPEDRLPGFVQVFEVKKAIGEFRPRGHYKEVIARVLCEDGCTRTIRAVEDYDCGSREEPPDGDLILEELKHEDNA